MVYSTVDHLRYMYAKGERGQMFEWGIHVKGTMTQGKGLQVCRKAG